MFENKKEVQGKFINMNMFMRDDQADLKIT